MTPKEIVQKAYDCFSTGDMALFKTLFSDSAIIKNNGMHKFSGTYHGAEDFINNLLVHIPSHFVNFQAETVQMISEGNHIFRCCTQLQMEWTLISDIFSKSKMKKSQSGMYLMIPKN